MFSGYVDMANFPISDPTEISLGVKPFYGECDLSQLPPKLIALDLGYNGFI